MTPDPRLLPALQALRAGDMRGALAVAETVLADAPQFLPALGIAALAAARLGDRARAEPLLRRQLALAPQDRAARGNLATLLVETGRAGEALDLVRTHDGTHRLARLAGYLHQQAGDLAQAVSAYEAAVAAEPADVEIWNNLGNARAAMGDVTGAAAAYETAIARGLSLPAVFLALCRALRGFESRNARLAAAREGYGRFPDDRELALEFALALAADGQFDVAEAELRKLAAGEDDFGAAHVELGLLLENLNRLDELDAHIDAAQARGLDGGQLAFLRAWSLRRHDRFEEAAREAERIAPTVSPIRSAQLRAEIADRLGNADAAFGWFDTMNRAAVAEFPPSSGPSFRETVVAANALPFATRAVSAAMADGLQDPAFIVGFPRSGTTLLDTLLMAMPELSVLEEQPMLPMTRARFADLATTTDVARLDAARGFYRAQAAAFGALDGRRLVDKNPLHMAQMREVQGLFPAASIVLVERHPCDAVLSCFMANFVLNHAMRSFTTLEEAARTYDAVFTAWERASDALPIKVHRVRYERMVADLAGEMRPLLGFLELPWRDEVLDNQKSAAQRGLVRTASYAQVGRPIYGHARERWRRYRAHMDPVLPILAPWAEKMGYEI